ESAASASARTRTRRRPSTAEWRTRAARRSGTAASCPATPCFLLPPPRVADTSKSPSAARSKRETAQRCVRRVSQSRPGSAIRRRRAHCYDGPLGTLEEPATVVSLTERAAVKIKELQADEPGGDAGVLRIAVQGGGCSGFEYALGFDRGPQDGDHELEAFGVRVVVDPFSAPYLQGARIASLDGLQKSGFKIDTPNVSSACGCGHSFQVEDGETPENVGGCGSGCSH